MNIQKYLPSKKIKIALIAIVILAFGYGIYSIINTSTEATESQLLDVALVDSTRGNNDYYKDTDGDGAYDWEELLWPGLDPNNPDSDGDGVLDGKYIQNKRSIAERERRGVEIETSTLTESEKFARSTATALLAIAQAGGTLDGETQVQFQKNVVNYISDLTLGDVLYTREQLELVADTKVNTYAYRNRMTSLFTRYPVTGSDLDLLASSIDRPEENKARINTAANKYSSYLDELINTEVPYVIAGRHTELINNVSQINGAFQNLNETETDELISLSLVTQLEKILNQLTDAILNINLFFEIIEDESLFETI